MEKQKSVNIAKFTSGGIISKEIIFFSILIILGALYDLRPPYDFSKFYSKFYPLPEKIIFVRFIFSLGLRVVLLIVGIGLLFRKDIFRKMIIFISYFTIITIYWKHPVVCFRNVVERMVSAGAFTTDAPFTPGALIWIMVAINYIIDVGFALCLIYFFTRPKIKEQFK